MVGLLASQRCHRRDLKTIMMLRAFFLLVVLVLHGAPALAAPDVVRRVPIAKTAPPMMFYVV